MAQRRRTSLPRPAARAAAARRDGIVADDLATVGVMIIIAITVIALIALGGFVAGFLVGASIYAPWVAIGTLGGFVAIFR